MATDEARIEAAAALRDLIHEFSTRDPDDDALRGLAAAVRAETAGRTFSATRPSRARYGWPAAARGSRSSTSLESRRRTIGASPARRTLAIAA